MRESLVTGQEARPQHERRRRSALVPILRSESQARILAALLLDPGRELSVTDLARIAECGTGHASEEVARLVDAGILTDRRIGRTRLVRAGSSTINPLLANLLRHTYGPTSAVETALRGIPGIERAFVVGSWAARYQGEPGKFPNDVDVVVVGRPNRDDTTDAISAALTAIGHDAQVIFRTPEAWNTASDPFTSTAKRSPLVELNVASWVASIISMEHIRRQKNPGFTRALDTVIGVLALGSVSVITYVVVRL